MALPPPKCGEMGHFTGFLGRWNYPQWRGTRPGERHDLWQAVDQDDNVLDILGQSHRHTHAAKKYFRTLLKGLTYVPRVIIAAKWKSYGAAKREILPGVA